MKKQNTTSKVGHKEPDRYPLGKFSKRLANRVARRKAIINPHAWTDEIGARKDWKI